MGRNITAFMPFYGNLEEDNQYLLNYLMQKNKASFILKLQSILENPAYKEIVAWSTSGASFVIADMHAFLDVLAKHFRHRRFSSFVRQLNMYGFHKCRREKNSYEFKHPLFTRSAPDDRLRIDRKKNMQVSFQLPTIQNIVSIKSLKEFDPMDDIPDPLPPGEEPASTLSLKTKFRLNSSEMTIKLNEKLTSLCNFEEYEESQVGQMKGQNVGLSSQESSHKMGMGNQMKMGTLFMESD